MERDELRGSGRVIMCVRGGRRLEERRILGGVRVLMLRGVLVLVLRRGVMGVVLLGIWEAWGGVVAVACVFRGRAGGTLGSTSAAAPYTGLFVLGRSEAIAGDRVLLGQWRR